MVSGIASGFPFRNLSPIPRSSAPVLPQCCARVASATSAGAYAEYLCGDGCSCASLFCPKLFLRCRCSVSGPAALVSSAVSSTSASVSSAAVVSLVLRRIPQRRWFPRSRRLRKPSQLMVTSALVSSLSLIRNRSQQSQRVSAFRPLQPLPAASFSSSTMVVVPLSVVFRVLHALCIFDVGGVRIYGDTSSFISTYFCAGRLLHVALIDEQRYHIVGYVGRIPADLYALSHNCCRYLHRADIPFRPLLPINFS